jgi:hypothetical protein
MQRARSWPAYAAVCWVAAYMSIHLHAAFTGSSWPLPDPPPAVRDDEKARIVEAGVCLILVGAILTALALARPWGRVLPRWMLLGIAWVGCAIGVLHWLIWTIKGLLRVTGVTPLQPEPDIPWDQLVAYSHRYDAVNLSVNEPWFLVVGILFGLAAVHFRRRAKGVPASAPGWMTGTPLFGVLGAVWAAGAAVLQGYWALGGTGAQRLGLHEPDNQLEFLGHLRGYFGVMAVLALLSVPLMLLLAFRKRVSERAAQVLAGIFLLGGLFVVLIGVMSFNAWIFGFYGPALMAGGVLFEFAVWRHRGRVDNERELALV